MRFPTSTHHQDVPTAQDAYSGASWRARADALASYLKVGVLLALLLICPALQATLTTVAELAPPPPNHPEPEIHPSSSATLVARVFFSWGHATRNRLYDPRLGRFLERDPAGDTRTPSPYVAFSNNPVNALDPMGLKWLWVSVGTKPGEGFWHWVPAPGEPASPGFIMPPAGGGITTAASAYIPLQYKDTTTGTMTTKETALPTKDPNGVPTDIYVAGDDWFAVDNTKWGPYLKTIPDKTRWKLIREFANGKFAKARKEWIQAINSSPAVLSAKTAGAKSAAQVTADAALVTNSATLNYTVTEAMFDTFEFMLFGPLRDYYINVPPGTKSMPGGTDFNQEKFMIDIENVLGNGDYDNSTTADASRVELADVYPNANPTGGVVLAGNPNQSLGGFTGFDPSVNDNANQIRHTVGYIASGYKNGAGVTRIGAATVNPWGPDVKNGQTGADLGMSMYFDQESKYTYTTKWTLVLTNFPREFALKFMDASTLTRVQTKSHHWTPRP